MTSLENNPFLPTFAVRMLYVFLLLPNGCLNFQSLKYDRAHQTFIKIFIRKIIRYEETVF